MASSDGKRTSRKRTFAEEENWFLVQYEDQPDTFRVLNEREVKHLDPEDNEAMQEGETIQAFWSADKTFYEAQIVKISDDKSELLKERRVLETSLRKSAVGRALASDESAKKKSKSSQKPQTKKVRVTDEEKAKKELAKKAKEAEKVEAEKKRNAEIAAKMAQATKRISQNQQPNNSPRQPVDQLHQEQQDDVHLLSLPAFRTELSTGAAEQNQSKNQPKQAVKKKQKTQDKQRDNPKTDNRTVNTSTTNFHPLSLPAFRTELSTGAAEQNQSKNQPKQTVKKKRKTQDKPRNNPKTDNITVDTSTTNGSSRQPTRREIYPSDVVASDDEVDSCETVISSVRQLHQATEPRIHPLSLAAFRTEPGPSSGYREDDESNTEASTSPACIPKPASARKQIIPTLEESDDEVDGGETVVTITCDNEDCQALLQENKSLKDKLKKLQRRLDIAVKAKSPTSILAGKPAAGIVDRELAAEYQMKEFFQGSGVYWYSSQRSICSACTKWEEYVNLAVDIFFSKEVLKISCAKGLKRGRKLDDTVPLCQPIVDAIIGKVCARFQPPPTVAQITLKINSKCTEARRPKRLPVHMSSAE